MSSPTRGLLPEGSCLKPRYCPCLPVSPPARHPLGSQGQNGFSFSKLEAHCPCRYWAADLEMLPVRGMMSVTLPAAFCLNFSIPVLEFLLPQLLLLQNSSSHLASGPTLLGWTLLTSAQWCNGTANNSSNTLSIEGIWKSDILHGFWELWPNRVCFHHCAKSWQAWSVLQVGVMWARAFWALLMCCAWWGLPWGESVPLEDRRACTSYLLLGDEPWWDLLLSGNDCFGTGKGAESSMFGHT